jgi:hypothetical protein
VRGKTAARLVGGVIVAAAAMSVFHFLPAVYFNCPWKYICGW